MARSYGKVLASIWGDSEWRALSRGAQHTYMLLLSQSRVTLAGSLDYMPARWAALTADATTDEIEDAIRELVGARFVAVDTLTAELVIRTLVRHDVDNNRLNINLVKGLWAAWSGIISDELRKVVIDNLPPSVWEKSGTTVPTEADQMRRSPRLELPITTTGPNHPLEPPVQTSHSNHPIEPPSPSPSPSPSPVAAASRDPRALPPTEISTNQAAAVDNSRFVDTVIDNLTEHEMERSPTRNGNPERHRTAVRSGKRKDYAPEAHRLHHEHPDLSPEAITALIEQTPTGATPTRRNPIDPAWNGEIARRYDIRSEAETQALLAQQRTEAANTDRATAAQIAAQTRKALRQPNTTQDPT